MFQLKKEANIFILRTYIFNAKGSLCLTIRLMKHKVLLDQRFRRQAGFINLT